jgi:FkbM family methyltransferase
MKRHQNDGRSFAVRLIQRLPVGQFACFRVWNKLLKVVHPKKLATTYFGAVLHCDARDLIQNCIIHFGVWEPDVSAAIESVVKPGDTVVDVGANIGYVTLLAASAAGPAGEVIAIDASPGNFDQLRRNILANSLANIQAHNLAVSEKRETLKLYFGQDGNCGRASTRWREGAKLEAEIQAVPLDEILTPAQRQAVSLIKIDVEGMEISIIRRLMDTLDLFSSKMKILVEFNPLGDGAKTEFDRLIANGFKPYAIENSYRHKWYLNWRRPTPPALLTEIPARQTDIIFAR